MDITADKFLKEVQHHKMEVRNDNGLYRHLVFRAQKDSWNLWFEVVTWPGCLAINGDMGSWTFARINDMFEFFRSKELCINPSYWSEKILSESRFGGPSRQFTIDEYRRDVHHALEGLGLLGLEKDQLDEIKKAMEEEVFNQEDEWSARRALADFKHEDFEFTDSWEIDGHEWSYHLLWCLYAIVWAISQYDAVTATASATKGE